MAVASLNPQFCLDCFEPEVSDLLIKRPKYAEAVDVLNVPLAYSTAVGAICASAKLPMA
jgi:hypothetical protein